MNTVERVSCWTAKHGQKSSNSVEKGEISFMYIKLMLQAVDSYLAFKNLYAMVL